MTKDNLNELFEIIEDLSIGMLVTEADGNLRSRPMKAFTKEGANDIWFLTKFEAPKVSEVVSDADVNVSFSCPKTQQYVSISGKAFVSRDQSKVDMMWSDSMSVWFDCEKNDPNVAAIRVIPSIAEYWDGKSNAITRFWEITKAKITGDKPELGDNETIKLVS